MNSLLDQALLVVAAYLLGSLPFSYLIVRLRTGRDVRTLGSGNAGATNVTRAAGKAAGILAALLDVGKGIAATMIARGLGAPPAVVGLAAFAVVLGHCHPVFLRFRGGKGGATGGGVLAVLAPPVALLSVLVLVAMIAWKRYVSLGTMTAAVASPLFVLAFQRFGRLPPGAWLPTTTAAIAVLIVARHHGNLRRLRAGTEARVGSGTA
ncbi:MAG TPA: glycerol-3-phosphate 1-O-acyltransferase PlsY [Thermoanaerobaculia bacterium]|nr:glycerol-3-phosphate 1-O-acyltransferase PlsY [Thermoanaerobaculia bacterium]